VRINWILIYNVLLESSDEVFTLHVLFWEVLGDCSLWIWPLEKRDLYTYSGSEKTGSMVHERNLSRMYSFGHYYSYIMLDCLLGIIM
jgi:hypothetical protein